MIKKIQEISTSSRTTLMDVPGSAADVIVTKVCPRATLQYQAKTITPILNLTNEQKFVGEFASHDVCKAANGFVLDAALPPITKAPEETSNNEVISSTVIRHHRWVKNFSYDLTIGGNVHYQCQEDSLSKTPKWILIRGCEVGISERANVVHTYYDEVLPTTPAVVASTSTSTPVDHSSTHGTGAEGGAAGGDTGGGDTGGGDSGGGDSGGDGGGGGGEPGGGGE